MTILGQDQIGLDKIGALFNGAGIGGQGMFGPLAATAPVPDNDRLFVWLG
jgi:hypothetical protein